jgi:hypothetical protein
VEINPGNKRLNDSKEEIKSYLKILDRKGGFA